MSVKAYLFDMDGTLADSEKVYIDKIYDFLLEHDYKGTYQEVEDVIAGSTVESACEFISEECGIEVEVAHDTFNKLFNNGHLDYKPVVYKEAKEVLSTLKDEGYKIALVTANDRININNFLSCGFENIFDCIVSTCEDNLPSKPQPDCYLKAMRLLNVKPHECIIVEDSLLGIEAGVASDAFVIATKQSKLHVDTSCANRTINNLIELIEN